MTLANIDLAQDYKKLIDDRVDEEYGRAGFTKNALDGATVKDDERMRARAFEVVSNAVVTSKADRSKKAVTNGELYAAVFPQGPGAQAGTADQLDDIESEVRTVLMRKVWALTQPSPRGYIQKRLGDGSLILCRGTVIRNLDEVQGCYVTDEPTLILEDSLAPQVDKLVRVANDLRQHASMITGRHPEIEGRVAAALGSGFARVKSATQLPAVSGNGKKPAETEQE